MMFRGGQKITASNAVVEFACSRPAGAGCQKMYLAGPGNLRLSAGRRIVRIAGLPTQVGKKNARDRLKDLNLWAEGGLFAKGAFGRGFLVATGRKRMDVAGGVSKNTRPREE
jgi:hypothetical protein